jgi:hypothetical protein
MKKLKYDEIEKKIQIEKNYSSKKIAIKRI